LLSDGKSHDCTEGYKVEVEVVSKTKVIERRVKTRVLLFALTGEKPGETSQCELSPPK